MSEIASKGILLGIGGVSRSGKSSLAAGIAGWFPQFEVMVLAQDDFVFPDNKLPVRRGHIDWERPDTIDFDRLGKEIQAMWKPGRILVLEGLFAFACERLNRQMTAGFFLNIPRREFIRRKRSDLRWGEEPGWYVHHIWRSYILYGRMSPGLKHRIPVLGSRLPETANLKRMLESLL